MADDVEMDARKVGSCSAAPVLGGAVMIELYLFNGAATRNAWNPKSPEFIDDWKPEERTITADHVQVTYATSVTLREWDGGPELVYLFDEDDPGLLVVDGAFYGDFTIRAVGGAS